LTDRINNSHYITALV